MIPAVPADIVGYLSMLSAFGASFGGVDADLVQVVTEAVAVDPDRLSADVQLFAAAASGLKDALAQQKSKETLLIAAWPDQTGVAALEVTRAHWRRSDDLLATLQRLDRSWGLLDASWGFAISVLQQQLFSHIRTLMTGASVAGITWRVEPAVAAQQVISAAADTTIAISGVLGELVQILAQVDASPFIDPGATPALPQRVTRPDPPEKEQPPATAVPAAAAPNTTSPTGSPAASPASVPGTQPPSGTQPTPATTTQRPTAPTAPSRPTTTRPTTPTTPAGVETVAAAGDSEVGGGFGDLSSLGADIAAALTALLSASSTLVSAVVPLVTSALTGSGAQSPDTSTAATTTNPGTSNPSTAPASHPQSAPSDAGTRAADATPLGTAPATTTGAVPTATAATPGTSAATPSIPSTPSTPSTPAGYRPTTTTGTPQPNAPTTDPSRCLPTAPAASRSQAPTSAPTRQQSAPGSSGYLALMDP